VRDNYERLIAEDPDRFIRVDASRAEDEVMTDVVAVVADLLDK
jgi:dTMP kinase